MSANTYLPGTPCAPLSLLITAITQAFPMVVTVATANNYVVGQLVTLTVPFDYGMFQANELTGEIIEINGLQFNLNIDSTQFDAFTIPATYKEQPASLCSSGSRNLYNNTTVPFHSLTNTGN